LGFFILLTLREFWRFQSLIAIGINFDLVTELNFTVGFFNVFYFFGVEDFSSKTQLSFAY